MIIHRASVSLLRLGSTALHSTHVKLRAGLEDPDVGRVERRLLVRLDAGLKLTSRDNFR